ARLTPPVPPPTRRRRHFTPACPAGDPKSYLGVGRAVTFPYKARLPSTRSSAERVPDLPGLFPSRARNMAVPAITATPIGVQLAHACDELERRLRAGRPGGAAELLGEFPELARDRNAVLELIYTEFVLREELGERPAPED